MLTINANIHIGDTARFPIGRLGDEHVSRHKWAVTAFTKDAIVVRRLHDGIERTVGSRWFDQHRTDEPTKQATTNTLSARLAGLQQRKIADARHQLQHDTNAPGFYVSARKGPQYALLLGPFTDLYTALQLVPIAWHLVRRYADPWLETSLGTCRVNTSDTIGKFNAEVFV